MKKNDRIKFIVYPSVLGIVSIAFSIGLVFYYRSKSNSTPISYVMCLILACVGIACVISAIIQVYKYVKYYNTDKKGLITKATFVSYETKSSVDKQSIYKVTIKYLINDNEYTFVTPSEYTWQEVLALKCAKEFDIKYYKNNCILVSDLSNLILRYSKEIAEEQKKYDEAFNKVNDVINKDIDGIQRREVTKVEEKKIREKIKEEDRPDTLDDIQ